MTVETQVKLSQCTHCFAVPGSDSMIDVIHPITGKTLTYGNTLDEVRARPGDENAEIMLIDDFCNAKAKRQDSPIIWQETTEEKYFEMLEVLPPAYMAGGAFLVGEPWDHHARTGEPRFQAFRHTDKYLVANRPVTRNELKMILSAKYASEVTRGRREGLQNEGDTQ
jgi:hypothetical protein